MYTVLSSFNKEEGNNGEKNPFLEFLVKEILEDNLVSSLVKSVGIQIINNVYLGQEDLFKKDLINLNVLDVFLRNYLKYSLKENVNFFIIHLYYYYYYFYFYY